MNLNTIYQNQKLKVTYFQNRFASDKAELKQKAAAEGRTVASTFHTEFDWDEFVKEVLDRSKWATFTASNPEQYNKAKEQFDAVVFAQMIEGAARSAKNVIAHYAVVLDIDDGITVKEVQEDLSQYEYVLYSSGGTGIRSGERFRVVLPLTKTLSADEWSEWSESLKQRFHYSDASFSKSLQIQYLPQLNTVHTDKFISHHNEGRLLDVMADVQYVEPIAQYINPVHPVSYEFTYAEHQDLLEAIINHNDGQLEYEDRRILGNRLAALGVNQYDMIRVLEHVGRSGATHTGAEIAAMANASYGHIAGLRKNLPAGYKLPMPVILPQYISVKPVVTEQTQYDYEIMLNGDQYLSDVADKFKVLNGVNLLICDCGVGKSWYWSKRTDVIMVAPLLSIVKQNTRAGAEFNNIHDGVSTYHQIEKILNDTDNHDKYKNMTLVIDEAHGLYLDSYRDSVNQLVHKCFSLFKSVVLMSGTIRREYFCKLEVVNTVRVRKVQPFDKVLTRIQCEGDIVGTAIKRINERQHTNKMVILLNDKDDIKVVRSKLTGIRTLEYTADTKDTAEIQTFLNSSILGEQYDCLIGTNSIVEGLNVNDVLKNCEVHVIGDCTPERIEQVTNRWRKCTGTIRTYHYTPSVLVSGDLPEQGIEITAQDYVDVGTDSAKAMNRYIQLLGDKQRKKYINTYRNENRMENVYWNDETKQFEVSFIKIDYQMANNRFECSKANFNRYAQELTEYGFKFTVPQRAVLYAEVAEERAAVAQDKKEQYRATIDLVISQVHDRGWVVDNDTPEAQVQREFVEGFIRRGLKRTDVVEYLERLKANKEYWRYLNEDMGNAHNGNSVLDLITRELPNHLVTYGKHKKQGLTVQGKRELAEKIARFVLVERFNGDVLQMRLGGWLSVMKNDPQLDSNTYINAEAVDHLLDSQDKTPDEVLNRYITLGKSERSRINGNVERLTPVKYLSLTGFEFESKNDQGTDLADVIKAKTRPVFDAVLLNVDPAVITQSKSTLKSTIFNRRMI
ncbi:hypothetical protein C0560_13785 [Lelliottia sp. AC1]|jgi:hypothetical protein|uniref:hypothetical protein n=1 Tax=Lelliottia sp. AC1 TaxID=2067959 RepID=UPI00201075A1|nr:hypothetical protein [Lelliottia sp. AC1]UQC71798.1 hypothetical protein C0560_13785 [Lelliottia sp. AC1]